MIQVLKNHSLNRKRRSRSRERDQTERGSRRSRDDDRDKRHYGSSRVEQAPPSTPVVNQVKEKTDKARIKHCKNKVKQLYFLDCLTILNRDVSTTTEES